MENFENEIAELLEVDEVADTDVLNDFESWDSLTTLSIIAHLDEQYRIRVSAQELNNSGTVGGLKNLVISKVQQNQGS